MNLFQDHPQLWYFVPDALLMGGAVLIILLAAYIEQAKAVATGVGVAILATYLVLCYGLHTGGVEAKLFSGALAIDSFGLFFKLLFGVVALVTLLLAFVSKDMKDQPQAETVSFLLALTAGMSFMAGANDLLMMYLSLETVSVLSYIMVGFKKHSRASSEAGLKYLLYGAMSSGVMIFGLSYFFGLAGSTNLVDLAAYFRELKGISTAPVTFFAMMATMTGLGFKIATFPTQMWCPDVYEGAPTPITAFLSVGPKAAGFAMTIRFFVETFNIGTGQPVEIFHFVRWPLVLAIISAITMTLGNLAAIPQRNLKRLMAYSSIGHAGYLLMGLTTLSSDGVEAILFYLVVYLLMNFGAFAVILAIAERIGTEEIEGYRGLGWRSPILAASLAIFLFSLTGLPPFAGFIGKYLLFAAVVKKGMYWLAIVAVINSVISLFYYARIIKAMYLASPLDASQLKVSPVYSWLAVVLALPILVLGIYWEPLIHLASASLGGLFTADILALK